MTEHPSRFTGGSHCSILVLSEKKDLLEFQKAFLLLITVWLIGKGSKIMSRLSAKIWKSRL